jgi:hypothetical protein
MMPLISFTKKRPGLVCLIFFLAAGTGQKSFTGKKIVSGLSGQNSRLQNILDLALITLPLSLSVDSHLSLSLFLSCCSIRAYTFVHLTAFDSIEYCTTISPSLQHDMIIFVSSAYAILSST